VLLPPSTIRGCITSEQDSLYFFVIPSKVMKLHSEALGVLPVVREPGKLSDLQCETKSR